jgi:hypothetical protein
VNSDSPCSRAMRRPVSGECGISEESVRLVDIDTRHGSFALRRDDGH